MVLRRERKRLVRRGERHLLAPAALEVHRDKARVAGLHQRFDHHIADIVDHHALSNEQIHDLRRQIGERNDLIAEADREMVRGVAQHRRRDREKQQEQDPPGDLRLFPVGIGDQRQVREQIQSHDPVIHGVHRPVFLLHDQRGALLQHRHAAREGLAAADHQHCAVERRAERKAAHAHAEIEPDAAVARDAQRHQPGQEAAAGVDQLQRDQRGLTVQAVIHHEIAQVEQRDRHKRDRHMHVEVLVPAAEIDQQQQEGQQADQRVIQILVCHKASRSEPCPIEKSFFPFFR